jgi:hypothetical protein
MITEQDFQNAAVLIGCDVAAVKAVTQVESGHTGFYPSGKIVIKFEGHIFHLYTKGKFDQAHPALSYPHWTEQYSEFGEAAYNRFNQAFALDPNAAMFATSWGAFQIMGDNYSGCGFKTVGDFVDFLKIGEGNQLLVFSRYVKAERIDKYLVARNWASFALRYNGALYQRNQYDIKLAAAYAQFKNLNT